MTSDGGRVVVLNPKSGGGRRAPAVRREATRRGYALRESADRGGTHELAREAAVEGASVVLAAGGDGTLNEVVAGVDDAGGLDSTTLGVVPAGTGNNFADRLGIRDVTHAFEVVERGRVRHLDLGAADGRTFVNSCVGGLTADASAATSVEMKRRWGVLAYVVATLREYRTFDGLHLDVTEPDGTTHWEGDAIGVLVGNGRRFVGEPGTQANMEDGLLNVVIIERRPAMELASNEAIRRFLRRGADHLTRLKAPELSLSVNGDDPALFSLDGEMIARRDLAIRSRMGTLSFFVTQTYVPNPRG